MALVQWTPAPNERPVNKAEFWINAGAFIRENTVHGQASISKNRMIHKSIVN